MPILRGAQHHKTSGSGGTARHWVIPAGTASASAWACLITKAAPYLRERSAGSTWCPALMLGRDGELLSGLNSLPNIATSQLSAAGLSGLTARSVRRCTVVAARDAELPPEAQEALASVMGNSTVRAPLKFCPTDDVRACT